MSGLREPERSADSSATNANDAASWIRAARSGDFSLAWRLSDRIVARHRAAPRRDLPRHLQSVWDGASIDGRRVLIRCYHGLGDTIQFIRYAPRLRRRAAGVIVWAQPALLPLLATIEGVDRWLPLHDGEPEAERDVDVEIMELAHVFRTTLATIPADVPYLHVAPAALDRIDQPRVGIVWRAGSWNGKRSVPFASLAPLLDEPSIAWYSLQFEPGVREHHARLAEPPIAVLLEMAAIARAMDLVISVDTMAAHLCGALGVPTWTLLPADADWRWLAEGSRTPWYPTMRLFRQEREGDWSGVLADVRDALASDLCSNGAGRYGRDTGRETQHLPRRRHPDAADPRGPEARP